MTIQSSLSFHNDKTWSLEHDKRTSKKLPDNVNPEDSKYNIYWKGNMTLKEFYDKYFEPSYKEYSKKLRASKRDNSYFEKISKTAAEKEKIIRDLKNSHAPYSEIKKHTRYAKSAYQIVITLGNCKENSEFKHNGKREEDVKKILSKYMNTFETRNKGLKMVCGAIHCDEGDRFDADGNLEKVGGNIHLHITYVPVAECSTGQKIQNSLTQALKMQGLESDKTKDPITNKYMTAQIKWQCKEREFISELCKKFDIEIVAKECDEPHRSVDDYQRHMEIKKQNEITKFNKEKEQQLNEREKAFETLKKKHPTIARTQELFEWNIQLSQRNEELERKLLLEDEFIQNAWSRYISQNKEEWSAYHKDKENLRKLKSEAIKQKKFNENRLKDILYDIEHRNDNIIMKIIKLLFSLFFRYKLKKSEERVRELVDLNEKMKAHAKKVVDAGKELSFTLKEKNINAIIENLDKWEHTIHQIEDDIKFKINSESSREQIIRDEMEKRYRYKVDYDDLR